MVKILIITISILPLSAAEFFLFGDSMAEAVAKPLEKKFLEVSIPFNYLYKRGTQVDYWINTPDLYNYIIEKHPDYILISLGTNDLVAKKSNNQIIQSLATLIDVLVSLGIEQNNIFLITTPLQNDNNLNKDMYKHFGVQTIVSKDLLLMLKADNIHPLIESNKIWSESIFNYIINLYSN